MQDCDTGLLSIRPNCVSQKELVVILTLASNMCEILVFLYNTLGNNLCGCN